MQARNIAIAVVLMFSLNACDEEDIVTGSGTPGDPTNELMQSETSIAVSPLQTGTNVLITYNDDTGEVPTYIQYTPSSRHVSAGASEMGWSLSSDAGRTWTYKGKIRPVGDSAVYWGDPSITAKTLTSGVRGFVFLTNLELPASTFPAGGIDGSVLPFLGGAVIARSQDGGQTFSVIQTVRTGSQRYDGSAIALSASGRVCAAYTNIDAETANVWCAEGALNTFVRQPDPFGANLRVKGHPRLVAMDDGTMYLAAWTKDAAPPHAPRISVTSWNGTSWTFPVFASVPGRDPENGTIFTIGDRILRTANQFTFTVGLPSYLGAADEVRVVYTSLATDGHYHLYGSACDRSLGSCMDVPAWTTGAWYGGPPAPGDQFNPKLAVSPDGVYKLIYYSTQDDPGGHFVSAKEGNLTYNSFTSDYMFQPFDFVPPHEMCSALNGYWGDYDYVEFNQFDPQSGLPEFIVGGTDSQRGCMEADRHAFDSTHQHVSVAFTK